MDTSSRGELFGREAESRSLKNWSARMKSH